MKYHHIGIPTIQKRPGEVYLEKYGMSVVGFENSDYGVEWLRFEPESPLPDLVKTVPHVAFVVDDLEPGHRVRFFGVDITAPAPGIRDVITSLEFSGIETSLDEQAFGLDLQRDDFWPKTRERYGALSEERRKELADNYQALIELVYFVKEISRSQPTPLALQRFQSLGQDRQDQVEGEQP